MRKNIYIPDDKLSVFKEAEKLFTGEKSISRLIVDLLEREVKIKKDSLNYETFRLENEQEVVKLIGKKIASYQGIIVCTKNIDDKEEDLIMSLETELNGYAWISNEYLNTSEINKMFNTDDYYELNAYRSKSGRIIIELKYSSFSKGEYLDLLEITGFLWKFIRKPCIEFVDRKSTPWRDIDDAPFIILPDGFIEKIKEYIGDDIISGVID